MTVAALVVMAMAMAMALMKQAREGWATSKQMVGPEPSGLHPAHVGLQQQKKWAQ